ncbi:MAG: hypothetical protein LBF86_06355 [Helicobacteraceae bacterium]|nr:hypothetical protein [Helicobacteraceae bacterium]
MRKFLAIAAALIAAGAINAAEGLPPNCQKTVFSEEESGYMAGYNCFYPAQTILGAYQIVKRDLIALPGSDDFQKLRDKLEVGENYEDAFGDYLIEYAWQTKDVLQVTIAYEAGDTTLLFAQQKTGALADVEFYIQ